MNTDSTTKSIGDNYIEWLVALSVAFATTFSVCSGLLSSFLPILRSLFGIFRNITLVLLLIYQIRSYGLRIRNRGFFAFFLLYSFYLFYYIGIAPVYKADELQYAPTTILNLLFRTAQVLIYMLCADTILQKFRISKFLLVSVFTSVLPSLFLIQYVGIDLLQYYTMSEDDNVDILGLGYDNAPLIVLCVLFFTNNHRNRIISILFASAIIIAGTYILIVGGERGPILWTIFNLMICIFLTTKRAVLYLWILLMVGTIVYANMDSLIEAMEQVAPHTAEKITSTIKEGNTSGRFDTSDPEGSTYLIGLNQFASSPIWGSYFRLITNIQGYRGHYPHNVFIEILMTMGMIGFIPFLHFLIIGWKKARKLFKTSEYSASQLACMVFFLAEFLHLQTSSTIVKSFFKYALIA